MKKNEDFYLVNSIAKLHLVGFTIFAALPFLQADDRWFMLGLALVSCSFSLYFEKEKSVRKKIIIIWIIGLTSSLIIVSAISNTVMRVIFLVISLLTAFGVFFEGSLIYPHESIDTDLSDNNKGD